MKKGEKPTLKQTKTIYTIHAVTRRMKDLRERSVKRPLWHEELAEFATLTWVHKMLTARDHKPFDVPHPLYTGAR